MLLPGEVLNQVWYSYASRNHPPAGRHSSCGHESSQRNRKARKAYEAKKGRTLNSHYAYRILQFAEAAGKCARERKNMQTIDQVLSTGNLTRSCYEVAKNKGAGVIDGMSVSELKSYLDLNRDELCETIRESKYILQPIRGKEILKRNGKTRQLGVFRW